MDSIEAIVSGMRRLARDEELMPVGSRVLVAVSGGQDSCALLHALSALRTELGIDLHAAHLNHGFRGDDAEVDAASVSALAESLSIPCTIESADVPGQAKRLRLSDQEAARRARHSMLDRVARERGADRIALGHTRDDRVETLLLNVLRGTGVDGLASLRAKSGHRIRPLLDISRSQTEDYCIAAGIKFRIDSTNESFKYTRNRIRGELLPLLESYRPDVRSSLLRLADLAEEDSATLEADAADALRSVLVNRSPDTVVLSIERCRLLRKGTLRRVIRRAIFNIRGDLTDIDATSTDRAVAAILGSSGPRFQFTLPNGDITVTVTAESVRIERSDCAVSPVQFERALTVPGRTFVPEMDVRFDARLASVPEPKDLFAGRSTICIDLEAIRQPITIRRRKQGDRLQPLGMGGTRKVQDILTDRKVCPSTRDSVPILEDREGIIWVAGHAVAERARVTGSTQSVIWIEMIAAPDS